MACKIADPKLIAIKKIVTALIKEGHAKTLKDVEAWMSVNRPEITSNDIKDAMIATSGKRIDETVKELNETRNNIKKEATIVDRLSDAIDNLNKPVDKDFPLEKKLQQVKDDTTALFKLLGARSRTMNQNNWVQVALRIEDIAQQYNDFFLGDKKLTKAHMETMKQAVDEIRNELQTKNVDKRISDLNKKIQDVKDGNIDTKEFASLNSHVALEATSKEVAIKQAEIADLKTVYDAYVKAAIQDAKINKTGLAGFKNPAAISVMKTLQTALREGWETGRTLKYMTDISALGVQLSAPVMSDIYFNQTRLRDMFKKTVSDVFMSDINAATERLYQQDPSLSKEENRARKLDALKRAHGLEAARQVAEIKSDPIYPIYKKAKGIISESRSIIKSEEMYHSTLLNRVPGFGFAKDLSDDIMVSPLNYYRFNIFKEFYMANPGLPLEEYEKIVSAIHTDTGTDSANFGKAGLVLSAARLAMSRFKLAFLRPVQVVTSIDVAKSIDEKGLRFQTAADTFIAKQTAKMWASYAATFAIFAALSALSSKFDVGSDWEDTDFMRVTAGNNKYEFTGGLGSMYRMLAQTILTQMDPKNASTFTTQERLKYQKLIHEDKIWGPFVRTMIENKLHPMFGGIHGVVTGKDYFEHPYAPGELSSRAEALLRIAAPISIETGLEQLTSTPNSNAFEDLAASAFQLFGVNSMDFKDKSSMPFAKDYFNKIKFKPKTDYPDDLSVSKNPSSITLDYLRYKYKNGYGTMIGNIIQEDPGMSRSTFESKVRSQGSAFKAQFLKENAENIKQLKKIKK